jgi:hypothetical protein
VSDKSPRHFGHFLGTEHRRNAVCPARPQRYGVAPGRRRRSGGGVPGERMAAFGPGATPPRRLGSQPGVGLPRQAALPMRHESLDTHRFALGAGLLAPGDRGRGAGAAVALRYSRGRTGGARAARGTRAALRRVRHCRRVQPPCGPRRGMAAETGSTAFGSPTPVNLAFVFSPSARSASTDSECPSHQSAQGR